MLPGAKKAMEAGLLLYKNDPPHVRNVFLADNITKEDLEAWGDPGGNSVFQLSERVKNRLLVNARQDAANAVLNSADCLRKVTLFQRIFFIIIAIDILAKLVPLLTVR